MIDCNALKRGDWVEMKLGTRGRQRFYIQMNIAGNIVIGKKGWLAHDGYTISHEELNNSYHEPVFIGPGKERWWWKYLITINDAICPFSDPK